MNQTKKRLAIIELAISITDLETIRLQQRKLELLRKDSNIEEILNTLEEENYAKAQRLISTYIDTPTQTVIQRIPEEEQSIIDQFDFLEPKSVEDDEPVDTDTPETPTSQEVLEEPTIEEVEEHVTKVSTSDVNFNSLLSVQTDDILKDNIQLKTEETSPYEKEKIDFNLDSIPKDSFFDGIKSHTPEQHNTASEHIDSDITMATPEVTSSQVPSIQEELPKDESVEEPEIETISDEPNLLNIATIETPQPQSAIESTQYKLEELQLSYPPLENQKTVSNAVEKWLEMVAEENYEESDIEGMLVHIESLSEHNKAEAAQLLLITSLTPSNYAKFVLARALYKGTLFERNLTDSFSLMGKLAYKEKYPEAICDLAQFYENGISVDKNKKEAKALYKEAMELGVERAKKHYERLEASKGLFSFFK